MAVRQLSGKEFDGVLAALPESTAAADSSDHSLLRVLSMMDRASLANLMAEQRYTPGQVIFAEGEGGDVAYLIWSGQVAVIKGDLASPTVVGCRGPGEIIGEMALLEDRPRSASIVALEPLRLLGVTRDGFQRLLTSAPAIGKSIMETLSARLRASDNILTTSVAAKTHLAQQVSDLQTEKQQLLELQRLRQETSDFVVHDLRNPLSIVCSTIYMLEMVLPPDILQANRDLLESAKSATNRMQRMVDALLDIAKMEAGESRLSLSWVKLQHLAEQAVSRVSPILTKRQVAIEALVPSDLPPVMADEEKIDRVLGNLVDNAMKYTTKAGGKIQVVAELQADQVVVSVTDTGPGIPPAERERIFERFAQVDSNKLARRGFGLGLTFCKLAVQAHGGKIWVEPGPGGLGSRFAFTLPLSAPSGT